jgi:hypothetical protein
MNKKNKTIRKKWLLDTSIQIKRLTNTKTKALFEKTTANGDLYASYFVLYEFKSGFILNMIEYYLIVKVSTTPQDAMAYWSDKRGRGPKVLILLHSIIASTGDIKTSDKQVYMGQIEAAIYYLVSTFYVGLKGMVGFFPSNKVAKFEIKSADDFPAFKDAHESLKFVPLSKFWEDHQEELEKLVKLGQDAFKKLNIEDMHKYLSKIRSDLAKADTHYASKGVGDAVIATDCPLGYTIATIDKSFDLLCPALDKEHQQIR